MAVRELAEQITPGALRSTGLIASCRHLEGRSAPQGAGSVVPDLAPKGIGCCSTRIAISALEIAAPGSAIDEGGLGQREAVAALCHITGAADQIHGLAQAALSSGG